MSLDMARVTLFMLVSLIFENCSVWSFRKMHEFSKLRDFVIVSTNGV